MRLYHLVLPLALLSTSLIARADDLAFTTGNLSFVLQSNPTPASFTANTFYIDNVEVTSGGSTYTEQVEFGNFSGCYTVLVADSPDIGDCASGSYSGSDPAFVLGNITDVLFSGSTANPTLLTGTFSGSVFVGAGPLVVTSTAATPEPSSFALLGTGLLAFAGAARRRFL